MKETLDLFVNSAPFRVHLFIITLQDEKRHYSKHFDDTFPSASMIKVPILLATLAHIEENAIPLSHQLTITPENNVPYSIISEQKLQKASILELLKWMITTSDNTATNVLIDYIGFRSLHHYFQKIGLKHTILQRKMMDIERAALGYDNITNARDVAHLFSRIDKCDLLTPTYSQLAIDLLSSQRHHESLRRYICEDVQVAHKTGDLDTVRHDAGIFYLGSQRYMIGVFLTEVTDHTLAQQLIGQISKVTYDYFSKRKEQADEGDY